MIPLEFTRLFTAQNAFQPVIKLGFSDSSNHVTPWKWELTLRVWPSVRKTYFLAPSEFQDVDPAASLIDRFIFMVYEESDEMTSVTTPSSKPTYDEVREASEKEMSVEFKLHYHHFRVIEVTSSASLCHLKLRSSSPQPSCAQSQRLAQYSGRSSLAWHERGNRRRVPPWQEEGSIGSLAWQEQEAWRFTCLARALSTFSTDSSTAKSIQALKGIEENRGTFDRPWQARSLFMLSSWSSISKISV